MYEGAKIIFILGEMRDDDMLGSGILGALMLKTEGYVECRPSYQCK
jgi:hypothetical protein